MNTPTNQIVIAVMVACVACAIGASSAAAARPSLGFILASLATPRFLTLPKLPEALGGALVDLSEAQRNLYLAALLRQQGEAIKAKIQAANSKMEALATDADGKLRASCSRTADRAGCFASKVKNQSSSVEGFKANLRSMVEFEQTLNMQILTAFAKYPTRTCQVLNKTAADVSLQLKLFPNQSALLELAAKVGDLQKGLLKKSKYWTVADGQTYPTKKAIGVPCTTTA